MTAALLLRLLIASAPVIYALRVGTNPSTARAATDATPHPASPSRRDVLITSTAPLVAASLVGHCLNLPANAASSDVLQVRKLAAQAKELRKVVKTGAAELRQSGRSYDTLLSRVKNDKLTVLVPLQAAMAAAATAASGLGLAEEAQKQLETLPLLMKGHMLELEQALGEAKFDEYVSKTTKATYPGGKVERELEEIEETADEFLELVAKRLA